MAMVKKIHTRGFALPSIMLASFVMLAVLIVALSATTTTRAVLSDQYHDQLARQAAESGAAFMISCLRSGGVTGVSAVFSTGSVSCVNNSADPNKSPYVLDTPNIKTRYTVQVTERSGRYYTIKVTGYTERFRTSNGSVWGTYSNTLGVKVHDAYLRPIDFSVVTRGRSAFITLPDGSLWSWGQNSSGQLGDGTTTDRSQPQKVMDNVRKVQVSGSDSTVYAVTTGDQLYAWGSNSYGGVGNNSTETRLTPVYIMSDVSEIYIISHTVYVIKKNGSLWAWGRNNFGQVGDGTTTDRATPYMVMASGAKEVFDDQSNYPNAHILKTDGSYWTMGSRTSNKIGDGGGSAGNQTTPVRIFSSGVKQVAVTTLFGGMSALMENGTVYRWGSGFSATPQLATGLPTIDRLVASKDVTFAVGTNGSLWSWGQNVSGNVGNGVAAAGYVTTPYQIFPSGTKDVGGSRFENAIIALKTDGTVWGWGKNNYCQLADGTTADKYSPIQISSDAKEIFTYSRGSFGGGASYPRFGLLKNDNSFYMWGSNFFGATGVGVASGNQCTPAKVLDNVTAIADSDYYTTFAVTSEGGYRLWSWGSNSYLQLGRPTSPTPTSRPGSVGLPSMPPIYY